MDGCARKTALRIRIVAPAGPVSPDDFEAGLSLLAGRGFAVTAGPHARGRRGYLAGTDAERLADLRQALEDPAADVVWFARGGYGTTRILSGLPPADEAGPPKVLAGFSDATALFAWGQRRHRLLYGPSVQELARPGVCRLPPLWSALVGRPRPLPGRGPKAKAGPWPVFGGCLSLLSVLVGTPWEPALVDRWLFLEDVGERLYRLDRLLTHLHAAGWFDRASGVLLGGFTGMGEGERPSRVADRVREILPEGKPLVTGLPVGHLRGKRPLPMEVPALWDGAALRFPSSTPN
ncbi:MAG: LD-carboxypeptidase [Acidobacteriota bacterium]